MTDTSSTPTVAPMDDKTWQVELVRWERFWTRGDRSLDTLHEYVRQLRKYRSWCAEGGWDTSSMDAADMWIDHVQRSRSQHMARYCTRSLRAYGDFLEYQYGTNPFKGLKLPPEPEPSAKTSVMAKQDDLDRLLATCDSTWLGLRDRAIIMTLMTGMRRSEVAALLLDDVDLVTQTIKVRTGKTKAARRTVYMPEAVQGALLVYLKATHELRNGSEELWLAGNHGRGLMANGIGQMLNRRGKDAGVDVRAHAFRRMAAGLWMAAGGSEVHLMASLGWQSNAMIRHYTKDVLEANALAEAKRLIDG